MSTPPPLSNPPLSHKYRLSILGFVLIVFGPVASPADDSAQPLHYDAFFEEAALRVNLVHMGTRGNELFGIDDMVVEPIWPGTRVHLIDPLGYGKYRFTILDQATGKLIFSKGYSSLFGEWLTTEEAGGGAYRSMPEPVRFPLPKSPVVLIMEVRDDKTGALKEIQRFEIDTARYDLGREQQNDIEVVSLHDCKKEPPATVDVVIVPDGYTQAEEEKMVADAGRFAIVLLGQTPFDKYADKISVRLVKAFSRDSGTDEPRKGVFRNTVVDTTFDTFSSPRYLTTANMRALREVAGHAPYDTIVVMVNTNRYGGGGIYDFYSIFPSDGEYDEYILMHEFGHGFSGLADEYYAASTGYDEDAFYQKGVEPWEPNITRETDRDRIKWKQWLTPGVEIPTLDAEENNDVVGLFEGAGYKAKGMFRPTRSSKMFSKGIEPFGPVNQAAIEKMIRYYTDAEMTP